MNYKLSGKILEEIEKAGEILINCHYKPDPDGVGSALALALVLKRLGKRRVTIISPSPSLQALDFLEGVKEIKKIDYSNFDFSKYDLWIIPDAANWWQITGSPSFDPPAVKIINFDHHVTNETNFPRAVVEKGLSSTCELLYNLFTDWQVKIDKPLADVLLTGIIGDTGVLKYPNVTAKTLKIVGNLMEVGADKNKIVSKIYGSISFEEIKYWGKVIEIMRKDEEGRFVWAAIDFATFEACGRPIDAGSSAASNFAAVVEDTDFGVVMTEEKEGFLSCNFRGRGGFDISMLARQLGGGGHKEAAGARIIGMDFSEAVNKVLETCRRYAKKPD